MARHEHAHEILGVAVALFAGDDDLVDVLAVEIADRALGERAFLVHQRRRGGLEREIAHQLPLPQQVFEVALDLLLGAGGAGGAQDHAHSLRNLELLGDLAELLAVVGAGDLAADAAAARGVGHQHAVTAGERQVRGQRRALGAALFLDHLHQHHLPALDDLLDLVLAAVARRAVQHLFHGVGAADGLDDLFLFFGAARSLAVGVVGMGVLGVVVTSVTVTGVVLAVAFGRRKRMRLAVFGVRGVLGRLRGPGMLVFVVFAGRLFGRVGFRHRGRFGRGGEFRPRMLDRRADLGRHRRVRGLGGRSGRRFVSGSLFGRVRLCGLLAGCGSPVTCSPGACPLAGASCPSCAAWSADSVSPFTGAL